MFTAYAEHLGYVSNQLNHTQYFCEECDQAFASAWGVSPGMNGYMRGSRFHCTHCGKLHSDHVAYIQRHEECPHKVRLSLKAFKDLVILEVYYEAVYFDDMFGIRARKNGKEIFRFDIKKQTATFSSRYRKDTDQETDIGNPFELDIFKESILRFFTADSLVMTNRKKELVKFLKELRETVISKMEKRLGHKVKSAYVGPGTYHGIFLTPLKNIAFRVTFPDSQNLPTIYRERISEINSMCEKHLITDYSFMQKAMDVARKGTDFITAVITSIGIPNTTAVRREIRQNFFECGRLVAAFDLVKNYDYALRLHIGIKPILNKPHGDSYSENVFRFLRDISLKYGDSGLVTFAENAEEMNIDDCVRLYDQLNKESKSDLITEGVRIRDLHDWMAKKHRRQGHKNLILDVPDHIIKRLSMQKDKLSFFLPKESRELLEAGEELHNCVASYGIAMQDHRKWIVLVANDKGKLAACLEVVGTTLVQAKLINNQRVAKDNQLNDEVIAWAEKANIDIKTNDVKIPIIKQVISA